MSDALLAVLLAALAGLTWGDRAGLVVRRLRAGSGHPQVSHSQVAAVGSALRAHAARRIPVVSAAVVLTLVVAGRPALGVVVAVLAVSLLGPGRRRAALADASRAQVRRALPRAADLLASCLAAGATPADAVEAVARAVPAPLGPELARAAAALRLGVDPARVWESVGTSLPEVRPVGRAFARASVTGAPLADAIAATAEDERARMRAEAEIAARRAGVRAVGPLAVCFLPAFLLLGVVPLVASIAATALAPVR